jgi:hypothetical protein
MKHPSDGASESSTSPFSAGNTQTQPSLTDVPKKIKVMQRRPQGNSNAPKAAAVDHSQVSTL